VLEFLRRQRYDLVSLDELLARLAGEGPPLRRTVAVTMDDGYLDQATVGARLFADFDCPVTTFVTTGFLDGLIWFWWDKVTHIFASTQLSDVQVQFSDGSRRYRWNDPDGRELATDDFKERCKDIPDADKEAAILRLAAAAEVELPDEAPAQYAPMSWDQLRACEELGVSFGPHTVRHPILARVPADRARSEIVESWERLRSEAHRPLAVFCYPNGRLDDFGGREIAVLRSLDFKGAVVTEPGYNEASWFQTNPEARYMLRRFGNADSLPHVVQFVSGLERLKRMVLGGATDGEGDVPAS
jgi:peptidoglycan/xylan/chitin deacetylase (PgdA/CDA1 family)